MSSLEKKRQKQKLIVIGMFAILISLLAFNILRPSEEEQVISSYSQQLLNNDGMQEASEEERERFRKDWENLSKPTQEKIIRQVMLGRLDQIRLRNQGLTAEERKANLDKQLKRMRERYDNMSYEEREQARERINSSEAAQMVKRVMDFYQSELTAREREELDPLMKEWFQQLEELSN
ncbi:MAG: hypothetical protein MK193_11120 [Lentisphaeria bacterium]|nr:hypothetical protein [Lentisphaeria bacterium]